MTKVMMHSDPLSGLFYDAICHADDRDVCTIVSTLSNVMVASALLNEIKPVVYEDGHVQVIIPADEADEQVWGVFYAVKECMEQAAEQHPENLRMY